MANAKKKPSTPAAKPMTRTAAPAGNKGAGKSAAAKPAPARKPSR